ncbi:MAG: peptidase M20, partial [Anaerolineae bacterium]|nr:peptidase M20 [Anaerolineae bacterium]
VGDRPAGSIRIDHPLVQGALSALEQVGVRGTLENGSTDANVPLSLGCPAVTVGVTRGSNAHRLDEYIETAPVADGIHHLVLLTLAAAAVDAT